jgi:hypothetical protein
MRHQRPGWYCMSLCTNVIPGLTLVLLSVLTPPPPGSAADHSVTLAMAGRTQHRCRDGSLVVMAPTTPSGPSWSAGSTVQPRTVRSRSVMALAARCGGRPRRGGSGSHGRQHRSHPTDRVDPLYGSRGRDSSYPSRTTGSDLSRSQFVSGEIGRIFPARKHPLLPRTTGTGQETRSSHRRTRRRWLGAVDRGRGARPRSGMDEVQAA